MKTYIKRCPSGFYAVMVWDDMRGAWSLWWSGSRVYADAVAVVADLKKHNKGAA